MPRKIPAPFFLVGLVAITLGSIAGFNWLIDPYGFWNPPKLLDIRHRPFTLELEPASKLVAAQPTGAEYIILGNSRESFGLPMHNSIWENKSRFNLAFHGASIREIQAIHSFLIRLPTTHHVLLGLDFFMFNANYVQNDPDNLRLKVIQDLTAGTDHTLNKSTLAIFSLFTSLAIQHSWKTISDDTQNLRAIGQYGSYAGEELYQSKPRHGNNFRAIESQLLTGFWKPSPSKEFTLSNEKTNTPGILREILIEAHNSNINTTLFIGPFHPRTLAFMKTANLYPEFKKWQQALVTINESVAADLGKPPFQIMDFSHIPEVLHEKIPEKGDQSTKLIYFYDANHYQPILGEDVLKNWLGEPPGLITPDRLTSASLDPIQARHERMIEAWLDSHPADAKELTHLWEEFLDSKY